MEKENNIGHNSNLLIEDAFKETIKDAYKASRAAVLALKMWLNANQFHRRQLTRKQQNWNFHAINITGLWKSRP